MSRVTGNFQSLIERDLLQSSQKRVHQLGGRKPCNVLGMTTWAIPRPEKVTLLDGVQRFATEK